jgi:hypothetical protein
MDVNAMTDNRPFWMRRTFIGFVVLFMSYGMEHYGVMADAAPLAERCAFALIGWGLYKKVGRT